MGRNDSKTLRVDAIFDFWKTKKKSCVFIQNENTYVCTQSKPQVRNNQSVGLCKLYKLVYVRLTSW